MESGWWCVGLFGLVSCVKLLLVPSYHSTDFEVHRNWLAITHSLPPSRWYYEESSPWTLDYPPLFAWFEWLLSQLAALVDPLIVSLNQQGYDQPSCLLFQRLSVMTSDLSLLYALLQYRRVADSSRAVAMAVLVLLNYSLLVVDHIHFQYNGFLFGLLLLSIVRLLQGRCLEAGFWFAVLLNFKHIFLYIAPAYFLYLLKHYCFTSEGRPPSLHQFSLPRLAVLGSVVTAVFALSFGPFLGQLSQVLSRLFPFKRGLCHAYWAPNVWALYSLADKMAAAVFSRVGLPVSGGGMTSGLVGEMSFQVLPSIPPVATMILTLAAMMPALGRLWLKHSSPLDFVKTLVLCAYSSFLFGWHVHEKAIMMVVLPLSLLAVEDLFYCRVFLVLSAAGNVSLFPLLHQPAETGVKLSLFLVCSLLSLLALQYRHRTKPGEAWLSRPGALYLVLLLGVQGYCQIHHLLPMTRHLTFLPLLLTSVTSALGVLATWLQLYAHVLTH